MDIVGLLIRFSFSFRFTESLTKTLRFAHPMVIVDLMELFCSGDVSSRHVLLQEEKVNLWADAHSASAFHAARKMNNSSKNIKLRTNSTVSAVLAGGGVGSAVLSGSAEARRVRDGQKGAMTVMEETRGSELQALVVIPKVDSVIYVFINSFASLLCCSSPNVMI